MRSLSRALLAIPFGGLALLLAVPEASAYPWPVFWHIAPTAKAPGAGGNYFLGGVRDRGLTCALCHVKAPGLVNVTITPTPAWAKIGAAVGYQPGTTYAIKVAMVGETKTAKRQSAHIGTCSVRIARRNRIARVDHGRIAAQAIISGIWVHEQWVNMQVS